MATDIKVNCPVCGARERMSFTYLQGEGLARQPVRIPCGRCSRGLYEALKKEAFLKVSAGCVAGREDGIALARRLLRREETDGKDL